MTNVKELVENNVVAKEAAKDPICLIALGAAGAIGGVIGFFVRGLFGGKEKETIDVDVIDEENYEE